MPYSILTGDYTSSIWLRFNDPDRAMGQRLNMIRNLETSYSPTTNWEKVFSLGDTINRRLNLTEKDVSNEVETFRERRKKYR
jgi:hypothetical protein